jgi:hypothetical protein
VTTRLFLTTDPPTFTPATIRGTWNNTALLGSNTYALGRARGGTNIEVSGSETSATANTNFLLARHVSEPLAGGSITALATWGFCIARQATVTTTNPRIAYYIYFTAGDTDTVRATMITQQVGGTNATTTLQVFYTTSYPTTTAVTIQPGDRMVIESGWAGAAASATSWIGRHRLGGTAGDLVATNASTVGVTTNCPFVEFGTTAADAALAAYTPPAGASSMPMAHSGYARLRPFLVR